MVDLLYILFCGPYPDIDSKHLACHWNHIFCVNDQVAIVIAFHLPNCLTGVCHHFVGGFSGGIFFHIVLFSRSKGCLVVDNCFLSNEHHFMPLRSWGAELGEGSVRGLADCNLIHSSTITPLHSFFLLSLSLDFLSKNTTGFRRADWGTTFHVCQVLWIDLRGSWIVFSMRAEICLHIVAVQKCSRRSFSMYLQRCLVCVCVVLSFSMRWTVWASSEPHVSTYIVWASSGQLKESGTNFLSISFSQCICDRKTHDKNWDQFNENNCLCVPRADDMSKNQVSNSWKYIHTPRHQCRSSFCYAVQSPPCLPTPCHHCPHTPHKEPSTIHHVLDHSMLEIQEQWS